MATSNPLTYTYVTTSLPSYSTSLISSLARVQQDLDSPQFVFGGLGGVDSDENKLFKKNTEYVYSLWRSAVYKIGKRFDIMRIVIPVVGGIQTGVQIVPVLYFDNEGTQSMGTIITESSYPNADKKIVLTSQNFGNQVRGKSNFFLELRIVGSALATVGLPITIDIETYD